MQDIVINNAKGITELTKKDLSDINGGDKFMRDLGSTIGSMCRSIRDTFEELGHNVSSGGCRL